MQKQLDAKPQSGTELGQAELPKTIRESVSLTSSKVASMRKTMFCLNCEKYHSISFRLATYI